MLAERALERRTKPRQSLRLPVEVSLPGTGSLTGITRDISADGVYFYVGREIDKPELMQFVVAFPPEYTLAETKKIRCTGEVVRIDRGTPSGTGIAAAIKTYEMLSSDSSYPFAMVRTPNTR